MTQSANFIDLNFDQEIEKTVDTKEALVPSLEVEEMAVPHNNRTLKELDTPDLAQPYFCIEYSTLDIAFELNSRLIRLLPTFRGLIGEYSYKHLKDFHVVCSTMKA